MRKSARFRKHPVLALGLGLLLALSGSFRSHAASLPAHMYRVRLPTVGTAQLLHAKGTATLREQEAIKGTHNHIVQTEVIRCPAGDPQCRDLTDTVPARTKLCAQDGTRGTIRTSTGILHYHVAGIVCQPKGSANDQLTGRIFFDGGTGPFRTAHGSGTFSQTLTLRPRMVLDNRTALASRKPAHIAPVLVIYGVIFIAAVLFVVTCPASPNPSEECKK